MMNEEDCLRARFEILLDGKTQYCRDTLVTAMGAAKLSRARIPIAAWRSGTCKPAN